MKRTKKALASLAIAGMVATMVPFNALATTGVTTDRLSGADRFQTAVKVADKFVSADTAILAPAGDANLVDALAAAPLAGKNSPILLTDSNTLTASTKDELVKLGVKKVYVVGAISDTVFQDVKAMAGVEAVQLKGANRIETAAAISSKLTNPAGSFVVGYGALADALSVASWAAANNYSILVANQDGSVPASESAYMGSKVYLVGGPTLVNDIAGATRLAGPDRFATNKAVLDTLPGYTYGNVYVANGEQGHLVDSLVASSLAAKSGAPIVLTDTNNGGDATAKAINSKLAADSVVVALGSDTIVTSTTVNKVVTGTVAVPSGSLSVTSVSAVSANSFKVVFNQAPVDKSKIAITVQRTSTPVTVTTSWNDAKTEATVTSSQNLPEGDYNIAVKNDATDLGTSKVSITAQKIAKISITSSKLAINNNKGYATYKVYDQYGNDITTSYLANNINPQSGAGNCTKKNGLITLTPTGTTQLITYSTVVISISDSTSGVSTSASLATSTALGTLSSLTLNKLTNANNKDLTAGDTANVWYIDYTATDISGNDTKDLTLVQNGLIDSNIVCSNTDVTVVVDQDPSDSNKAVIKVTVNSNGISADMPVNITAMTYSGTTSTLNLTLHKQSKLDSITLMAPAYDIASGEEKEIPFIAYDQNGTQLTKYSDLEEDTSGISLTGCYLKENVDGTGSIYNNAVTVSPNASQSTPEILTAVTSTGKLSTITLNIQKPVSADTLTLDSSVLINAMQQGAKQGIDFGYNWGGLTVKDQYGRVMDMTKASNQQYEVLAVTTNGAISFTQTDDAKADITATNYYQPIVNANGINIYSNTPAPNTTLPGSATITFKLINVADQAAVLAGDTSKVIDSKNMTMSIIKDDDIKGYTIDTVKDPILCSASSTTTGGAIQNALNTLYDRNDDYAANPYVYGTTASGAKVVLAGTPIKGVTTSSTDFVIDGTVPNTGIAYDGVSLVALKFADSAKTGSSTTLAVTLKGADGNIHTVTTPVTSTTADAVAKSLNVKVKTQLPGVSMNDAGDEITLDTTANLTTIGFNVNNVLARQNAAGSAANRSGIYFYAVDQYNSKAMQLSNILVVSDAITTTATGASVGNGTFAVNSDGTITSGVTAAAGQTETIVLSAVTNNGLVKTVKVIVKR